MRNQEIARRNLLKAAAAFGLAGNISALDDVRAETSIDIDAKTRAERIAWLQANAVPIRSIDPSDTDFSDLKPIAKAIGEAEMVMLGERTHGDGSTFLFKSRLVRFLHEHLGFDVLAFESGFYSVHRAWQEVRSGGDARAAARRSLLDMYWTSKEVQAVLQYAGTQAQSDRPLELAGFDSQFRGPLSLDLASDLARFLQSNGIDIKSISQWEKFRALLREMIVERLKWKPLADDQRLMLDVFDNLSERIASSTRPESVFWRQLLKMTKAEAQRLFKFDLQAYEDAEASLNIELVASFYRPRDAIMGDNLLWLTNRTPRRKIIVWAHSGHNARNYHLALGVPYETMGHIAWKALGHKVFNLAFLSYDGAWQLPEQKEATSQPVPRPGSLEDLWAATSQEISFLDLRGPPAGGEWLNAPFRSSPTLLLNAAEPKASAWDQAVTAPWSQIFDAFLFIRTMRPSTRAT